MTYALARDVTAWGSSSTAGNQDATGTTYLTQIDAATDGPGIMRNKGLGGRTEVQILADVTAGTSAEKAGDTLFQFGGNGFNSAGDAEDHYNAYLSSIGIIGHDRFLAWLSHNASTEVYGSQTWMRARKLHRAQWNRDPGKAIDLSYLYRYWPTNDKTDDTFPTALRADASHLNQDGYIYGSAHVFTPWAEAMNGGLPFIAPYARLYTNSSTAHANGGFVADVPYVGDATGTTFSFDSPQTDFAISATGRITRATVTALTADYYDLPILVTRGLENRVTTVRVSVGSATTAPSRVTYDGAVALENDIPFAGTTTTSKKISIAIDLEFTDSAQDSTQLEIVTTAAGLGVVIRRLTTGAIRIFVRDANNTAVSVASLTSTQLLRVANGRRWVFFEIDTSTQTALLIVDETTAITSTPTIDLALNTGGAGATWIGVNSSISTYAKFHSSTIWIGEGAVGFSNPAVRALFRNSGTLQPLDLGATGAVNGVTPYLYLRGSASDYQHGKNAGTGGDLIAVDKGRFVTQTLATQPITYDETGTGGLSISGISLNTGNYQPTPSGVAELAGNADVSVTVNGSTIYTEEVSGGAEVTLSSITTYNIIIAVSSTGVNLAGTADDTYYDAPRQSTYPLIRFRVNLDYSVTIGASSTPYSQFALNNQSIGIPGVGRLFHGEEFTLDGIDATYVRAHYTRLGRLLNDPRDTIEVLSVM